MNLNLRHLTSHLRHLSASALHPGLLSRNKPVRFLSARGGVGPGSDRANLTRTRRNAWIVWATRWTLDTSLPWRRKRHNRKLTSPVFAFSTQRVWGFLDEQQEAMETNRMQSGCTALHCTASSVCSTKHVTESIIPRNIEQECCTVRLACVRNYHRV